MAFSFSPGQIAPQGSQAIAPAGTGAPNAAVQTLGPPSDSPFLIIRERSEGKPISVLACIQVVLFTASILSVIICSVMYGYTVYLKDQVSKKQQKLLEMENGLPDYPYEKMSRLTKRMSTLDNLLKNYISARSPLKFLENIVENQVVFDNFILNKDRKGSYNMSFVAITTNYKFLIQQLEALKLTEYKKIAPSPKTGQLDAGTEMKIMVTTPILVQGKLTDDVIFIEPSEKQKTSSASSSATLPVASSTKTAQ
jgi:hypothetical protein